MAVEVTMPQMGADMTEGTLVRWVKQVGDQVTRGDVIAEIETDKATVELEAYESGTMAKQTISEGETVPVGEVIALLTAEGESLPDGETPRKPQAETPARRTLDEPQPSIATAGTATVAERAVSEEAAENAPPPPAEAERAHVAITPPADGAPGAPGESGGRLRVSPVARRIAEESNLDLAGLRGTGPDGRILRRDVEGALQQLRGTPRAEPVPPQLPPQQPSIPAAAAPASAGPAREPSGGQPVAEGQVQPLSRMRQAIARRMTASKQQQPHYYLTLDVDMTSALAFRAQVNDAAPDEQRVSINDLVVKACAAALERHPKFNAEYTEAGLRMHEQINIDIAVALDEGLIAPAILNCRGKSLGRIAAEGKDLVSRAKSGRLRVDEYSAGTFTITNLGAFGVETLIGIINPPQAAILGVGSVMPQAVVRDGEIVVRQVMKMALSADHRVTDGAEGARFIKEIQLLLENPAALAL